MDARDGGLGTFAAIAPICGSGICWYGGALKDIPIMVYHGDCDEAVPITDSIGMVSSVNKRGGCAQIKILYGVGHNAWDTAYKGDELYNWMLSHKLTRGE